MVEKGKYIPIKPVRDDKSIGEMREKYGSAIYAIDPYVEVFKVMDNVWAMLAPCTHAMGDNWIYLIEGPEKALFIDSGFGVGNLLGLGELLTGKICVTAPTHEHGDHAYGCSQFSEVYALSSNADMLRPTMSREAWESFNHVHEDQFRPYFLEDDVVKSFEYDIIVCPNHYCINLGEDYDVEMIHVGGHSCGETCFLDKKAKVLYTGDAYFFSPSDRPGLGVGLSVGNASRPGHVDLHPEFSDFRYFAAQTAILAERSDEWDYCMPGHGPTVAPGNIVADTDKALKIAMNNPFDYNEKAMSSFGPGYNVHVGDARIRYSDPQAMADMLKEDFEMPAEK